VVVPQRCRHWCFGMFAAGRFRLDRNCAYLGGLQDEAEIITNGSHHHMRTTAYGNDSRRSDLKTSRYIV
jgi:hypothetical protein